MKSLRKVIGLLIILLFGLPTLFGIIWAVGLTRAAVSPELLSDMPQEVIEQVPAIVEDVFEAARHDNQIEDVEAREWLRAADRAGISPRQLLEDSGIGSWLRKELWDTTTEIGQILRGEIDYKSVFLDFRPLKEAFRHETMARAFEQVVENLPPCDPDQTEIWKRNASFEDFAEELPPCRPEGEAVRAAWGQVVTEITRDIPDEVEIFEDFEGFPRGIPVSKTVISLTYLLFIIPAAFILIGSLIAATSKNSFFRWSGISTLLGALPALGLALLARQIPPYYMNHVSHPHWWDNWQYSGDVPVAVLDRLSGVFGIILDNLFTPVVAVAGAVCVVGIILFALSFAFTQDPGRTQGSSTPSPSTPAKTPEKE